MTADGLTFDYPVNWIVVDNAREIPLTLASGPDVQMTYNSRGMMPPDALLLNIYTLEDYASGFGITPATVTGFRDFFETTYGSFLLSLPTNLNIGDSDVTMVQVAFSEDEQRYFVTERAGTAYVLEAIGQQSAMSVFESDLTALIASMTVVEIEPELTVADFPPDAIVPVADTLPNAGVFDSINVYTNCSNERVAYGSIQVSDFLFDENGALVIAGDNRRIIYESTEPGVYENVGNTSSNTLFITGTDSFVWRYMQENRCTRHSYHTARNVTTVIDASLLAGRILPAENLEFNWDRSYQDCDGNLGSGQSHLRYHLINDGNELLTATSGNGPVSEQPWTFVSSYDVTDNPNVYVKTTDDAEEILTILSEYEIERINVGNDGCQRTIRYTVGALSDSAPTAEIPTVDDELTHKTSFADLQLTVGHPLTWVSEGDDRFGEYRLANNQDAESYMFGSAPGNVMVRFRWGPSGLDTYVGESSVDAVDVPTMVDNLIAQREQSVLTAPEAVIVAGYDGLFYTALEDDTDYYMSYLLEVPGFGKLLIEGRMQGNERETFTPVVQTIIETLNNEAILTDLVDAELPAPTYTIEIEGQLTYTQADGSQQGMVAAMSNTPVILFAGPGVSYGIPEDTGQFAVNLRLDESFETGTYTLGLPASALTDSDINFVLLVLGHDAPDGTGYYVQYLSEGGTLDITNDLRTISGSFESTVTYSDAINSSLQPPDAPLDVPMSLVVSGTFENIPIPR